MDRSHPQHKFSGFIPLRACRAGRAKFSGTSAGHAAGAPAADDGACFPELENGERGELEPTAAPQQAPSGKAAAVAPHVAQDVKGGNSKGTEPTAGAKDGSEAIDLGKNMLDEILVLKQKQKEARIAKLAAGKELRNVERRRVRLKNRAKQLSDEDLLTVISLRNHAKAAGQRKVAEEEIVPERAVSSADDPDAGPSCGATPAATTSASKKQRSS